MSDWQAAKFFVVDEMQESRFSFALLSQGAANVWAALKVYFAPRSLAMYTLAGSFSYLIGRRFVGIMGTALVWGPPIAVLALIYARAMEAAGEATRRKHR